MHSAKNRLKKEPPDRTIKNHLFRTHFKTGVTSLTPDTCFFLLFTGVRISILQQKIDRYTGQYQGNSNGCLTGPGDGCIKNQKEAEEDENYWNDGIPPDFIWPVSIWHLATQDENAQSSSPVKNEYSEDQHICQLIKSSRQYQYRSPYSLPQQGIRRNVGFIDFSN